MFKRERIAGLNHTITFVPIRCLTIHLRFIFSLIVRAPIFCLVGWQSLSMMSLIETITNFVKTKKVREALRAQAVVFRYQL
ncbi:hypothetical protein AO390_25990 [Pseudomonas marginalis ICMP 11289]|nr:hypothetical protein AO390_25990 [Pseudomonas marginalis ICMP 11289]